MAPEYAEFDGSSKHLFNDGQFYSNAYRVAINIGLDAAWFVRDEAIGNIIDRLQAFFSERTKPGEREFLSV